LELFREYGILCFSFDSERQKKKKKKEEKDNNGRQETTQKITDRAARSQPKNSGAPQGPLTMTQ
jgi:ribonuclease PH